MTRQRKGILVMADRLSAPIPTFLSANRGRRSEKQNSCTIDPRDKAGSTGGFLPMGDGRTAWGRGDLPLLLPPASEALKGVANGLDTSISVLKLQGSLETLQWCHCILTLCSWSQWQASGLSFLPLRGQRALEMKSLLNDHRGILFPGTIPSCSKHLLCFLADPGADRLSLYFLSSLKPKISFPLDNIWNVQPGIELLIRVDYILLPPHPKKIQVLSLDRPKELTSHSSRASKTVLSKTEAYSLTWLVNARLQTAQLRNWNYNLIGFKTKEPSMAQSHTVDNTELTSINISWECLPQGFQSRVHEFQGGPSKNCFETVHGWSEAASKTVYVCNCIFLNVHSIHQSLKGACLITNAKICCGTGTILGISTYSQF